MSRTASPPLSLSWMIRKMKFAGRKNKQLWLRGYKGGWACPEAPTLKDCAARGQPRRSRTPGVRMGSGAVLTAARRLRAPPGCGPSRSLVLARAERCTGLRARPGNPHSREFKNARPEANAPAEATETNPRACLVMKKILDAGEKTNTNKRNMSVILTSGKVHRPFITLVLGPACASPATRDGALLAS
uniref:Ribosomal protein L18-like n=1 Tax=Tursiops truncatus TaxID=9739 RepID=A0A2U4CGB3_TURTR|nr:ribosomal protein L18-like [Tursiops truncatus]